ncbi:chorismate-binding protein [archaeon AH-315-M20]|nr:chorismate-binding protein [archaeon AH-315-M20]
MLEDIKQAKPGSIVPIYKEIDEEIDAFEYFVNLSNYGKKKNSLLLQDNDISIGTSNPCLLVTGKDNEFEVKALNDTGKRFLQFIKKDFGFCEKAVYSRGKIYGTLNSSRRAVSEDQRLKLKTHMDIIRAVAFKFKPTTRLFMPYCGLFGMISYDFVNNVEDLPKNNEDLVNDPDYILYFLDNMFIVNHKTKKTYFVANILVTDNKKEELHKHCTKTINGYEKLMDKKLPKAKKFKKKAFEVKYDMSKDEFLGSIKKLKRHIADGDIIYSVPSRMAICNYNARPLDIYTKLKNNNSMFYLNDENGMYIGYGYSGLKVKDGLIELNVATTVRPRDNEDKDMDNKYEMGLRIDENEIVKHTMLVDATRNEVAKVSKAGTRYADKLFIIEKQDNVQSLVSNIKGVLREELDALHAFLSTINFSVGFPKLSSMSLLREIEKTKRCFYSGSFVIITPNKELDSKTIGLIRIKKDKLYTRVGSYVSYYFDEENIADKNEKKLSSLLDSIKDAGGLK